VVEVESLVSSSKKITTRRREEKVYEFSIKIIAIYLHQ